ncbi:MAG: hypothetical protein O3A51_02615 [Verrucomicrobia bacterium]|nr:hypothetical protein [Verrucomicrobiota bacterium]
MAQDAQTLADMVMQAAQTQQEDAEGKAKETLAGAIVNTVRKTFETLMNDPSARTQKGKKELQKQLRNLEKELLSMADKMATGEQEPVREALRETVDKIEDELQIDSLASEYMKRMKAIEKTEKRLMRYMKSKDIRTLESSELATRLRDDGLADDQIRDLLLRGSGSGGGSGTGGPGDGSGGTGGTGTGGSGSGGGGSTTIDQLGKLLSRMEEIVGDLAKNPELDKQQAFSGVLNRVSEEMGNIVEHATRRAERMADDLRADAEASEQAEALAREHGIGLRMPRHKILDMLAELNQELCQPLSVINCSMDMILNGMLGAIPDNQKEILNLIAESTGRLQGLIGGLEKVAGVPAGMSPDRNMIDAITATKPPGA